METIAQMLREGRICPQDSQTDDVTLTAVSDTLGEPVHQIQTGFFPDPEFTVFRAQDIRLVIARLEHRIAQTSAQLEKLTAAKQYAESLR